MRLNETVEGPHRPDYDLIVLAASAGGFSVLQQIVGSLPPGFPVPLVIVFHRTARVPSLLPRILARSTSLVVKEAVAGERIQPGVIYIAPADRHLKVNADRTFSTFDGQRIRHLRASANPLLDSAAEVFGKRVIAVVLSGTDSDATDGVQRVKEQGGVVIAQDQATSRFFGMPSAAIASGAVDLVLPAPEIAPVLLQLTTEAKPRTKWPGTAP